MGATPVYAFPYLDLGDPPDISLGLRQLALAVEGRIAINDADRASIKTLLSGFAAPTQTGSGTLGVGGTGATIMSVAVPDPGFPYHIIAEGSLDWAMSGGALPGNLLEGSITINSTTYNVSRLCAGFAVSASLGAAFNQTTLHISEKRSDAFGAQTGAKTVRLIARNSGAANMTLPAASPATSLSVRIVPA